MKGAENRLYELLDSVLDGSCTDEQRREFSQLLDEHSQLVGKLTEEVFVHNLLVWQADGVSSDFESCPMPELLTTAMQFPEPREKDQRSVSKSSIWPRLGSWGWALAATLLGLAALATGLTNRLFYSANADLSVAELQHSEGVVWTPVSTAISTTGRVMTGRLESQSGDFTLQFRSGPIMRVRGPASLMIESDMLVHLDHGQATARVPENLPGFTIKTPVINVIEQGTEFGVATRRNGFTDVVVFDGNVDLEDGISAERDSKRLVQGEAARIDRQGSIQRIMQIGRDSEGDWWTADYPVRSMSVIKEVRDNIPPSDGSKYFCYQITYQGLKDDVFAYADHPHQWNGLTGKGLPEFLVGADFVKTFNDYRYLNDFQMEVLLERPAWLYVFFDDRVPPPRWLTEQFEDTGVDIGLDEGPWPAREQALRPDLTPFENGVGGGKSIDNVFSVWKMRCVELGPITLGPVGETVEARAMYGIAATPLTEDRNNWLSVAAIDGVGQVRNDHCTAWQNGQLRAEGNLLLMSVVR